MRVAFYNVQPTEYHRIAAAEKEFGIEIHALAQAPSEDNLDFACGCDCVTVRTGVNITETLIRGWAERGIHCLSTRSIGVDHIDVDACRKYGVALSNVSYTQDSVANYTVMLMLMLLRKMKYVVQRTTMRDFSLPIKSGRNLANCTVGVIGTGRIGARIIRNLSGFGCKILCNDIYENSEVAKLASYVDLDTLLKSCDIITLHAPAVDSSYHLLDAAAFSKMKTGAVVINAARGTLLDADALLEALESGKVGAAALDVAETEGMLFLQDKKDQIIPDRTLSLLNEMPNVILTPHMAFDTEESMDDIVRNAILSCIYMVERKENPWLITR